MTTPAPTSTLLVLTIAQKRHGTMLLGVWHFSFTVSDIRRSVDFYRDSLGFELVHEQEQRNEYTSRLVGYPDAHLRVAQLAVPGQPRGLSTHDLELVEYVNPRGQRATPDIKNPGEGHLCISVTDIHEQFERLVANGVHFFSPPNAITQGVNEGGFTCYFHDPDQIVLELQQAPPARQAAYLERRRAEAASMS